MQLQFLAPVELFFKQVFPLCGLSCLHFYQEGSFNHFGRSETWNSTLHGRYVFPSLRCAASLSISSLSLSSFSVSLLFSLSRSLSLCPCLRVMLCVLCCIVCVVVVVVCVCGVVVEGCKGGGEERREKGRDKSDHLVFSTYSQTLSG